ncbi:MAG: GspJ family type II secretion system protein [Phycisphaerales bacterium]|nr:GspJ family type II secretion system protein [Phycisphaerales bacterium]
MTRRGFTMVELLTAGIILALVLAAMGLSLGQVNQSRDIARARADAFLRADAAMRTVRRELVSLLRMEDLYYTRLLLVDGNAALGDWSLPRDELLVFNNRVQATRSLDYNGDGSEFESAFRIEHDDDGPVLWHRRDAMPDKYPRGGGIAYPAVEGIAAIDLECWDGEQWYVTWDSDQDGLPQAMRVTITATGAQHGQSLLDAPDATLQTIVPLDRSRMPLEMADKMLAEAVMEKWALEEEQYDAVVEAIASNGVLPLPAADGGAGGPGLGTGDGSTITLPDGIQLPPGVTLPDGVQLPSGGGGRGGAGSAGPGSGGGGGGGAPRPGGGGS